MKNPNDELIWAGSIHMGDEPGVYGDAAYSGLCAEFPISVRPFDPQSTTEHLTFHIHAENVRVYQGYSGHQLTVSGYEPDPVAGQHKWRQVTLLKTTLNSDDTDIPLKSLEGHEFISFQVRVDTTVAAGLYNDFVLRRLSLHSDTHYAVVGFVD